MKDLTSRLWKRPEARIVLGGVALLAAGMIAVKLVRHRLLAAEMATLPAIVLGADGHVRVNGEPLVIAGDGAPPELLARLAGAAPEELPVEKHVVDLYADEGISVCYYLYRRTGVHLHVHQKTVVGKSHARWFLKLPIQGDKAWPAVKFRGTIGFRGREWWITDRTPPTRSEFRAVTRPDDYVPSSIAEKLVGELARISSRSWELPGPAAHLSLTFDDDGRIQSIWLAHGWDPPLAH